MQALHMPVVRVPLLVTFQKAERADVLRAPFKLRDLTRITLLWSSFYQTTYISFHDLVLSLLPSGVLNDIFFSNWLPLSCGGHFADTFVAFQKERTLAT